MAIKEVVVLFLPALSSFLFGAPVDCIRILISLEELGHVWMTLRLCVVKGSLSPSVEGIFVFHVFQYHLANVKMTVLCCSVQRRELCLLTGRIFVGQTLQ